MLNNSNVVVVWGSYDQAASSSMQDVYGQILSPAGQTISSEFLINQFTPYNQRTPAVAALANGGFVVAWVSEQERTVAPAPGSSHFRHHATWRRLPMPAWTFMRGFTTAVAPRQGDEFLVNPDSNPCANPAVAAGSDGSFMVAWDAHDMTSPFDNGLDIYAWSFYSVGRRRHGVAGQFVSLRRPICAANRLCGNGLLDCLDELGRSARRRVRTIPAQQWFNRGR